MSVTPTDPPTRTQAAVAVLAAKRATGLRWDQLAEVVGRSTVWTTSALLGQQTLTAEQAAAAGSALDLDEGVVAALTLPPIRGSR